MAVREVEWKNPYTWGKAIEIDENKVISLRLRAENNLIIYDEWDDEIYVDLQLDDEIRPTDAFPVWVTTGRVIIDNWWDVTWTVLIFKTTSGDYVMLLYWDDGKVYVDNGTGSLKQIYLKAEVDALIQDLTTYINTELAKKQDILTAWANIIIQDIVDPVTWEITHEISANNTIYSAWAGININNDEISVDTSYITVIDSTAPATPSAWQLWLDTASYEFKLYDGTWWLVIAQIQPPV